MSIKKGDTVKHISGQAPIQTAEKDIYVVLECFTNIAKQPTVSLKNLDTGEEVYRNPDTLELV